MNRKTILLLVAAVAAGLAAAYFVDSQSVLGRADADYYCYELRQAWVCAYTRSECEARLDREGSADIEKRCTPHTNDPPSP